MIITVALGIAGGLGLFLYGMSIMGDGLQSLAGQKMRSVLSWFTKNRAIGVVVGALFTAIIQSSSAVAVMVVSFVNAALMTVGQSIGVILGANIGTTITAQLVSFKLSKVAPVFVLAGVIMWMFFKDKKRVRQVGQILFGFGVLFLGITMMEEALTSIKDTPAFTNFFSSMSNPVLCILIGLVVTAILQSASAFVAILVVLCATNVMTLPICIYMTLGSSVGQCVSAMLVSLTGKKDGKRAALVHLLFNVFATIVGGILIYFLMGPFTQFIVNISGGDGGREVANAHTIIRIIQVIYMYPFMGLILKLIYKIVPGTDEESGQFHLEYIPSNKIYSPTTIMMSITQEIERMGEMAIANMQLGMEALLEQDEAKANQVYETEKYIDYLDQEITKVLRQANTMKIPYNDAKNIGGLFHVVSDLERVGDYAENFADASLISIHDNVTFSETGIKELETMAETTHTILVYALDMFTHNNYEHLQEIRSLENVVDIMEDDYHAAHIRRLGQGKCSSEAGILFSDVVSGLERISDHATNIAFAIFNPEEEKYMLSGPDDGEIASVRAEMSFKDAKPTHAEAILSEEIQKKRKEMLDKE